MGVKSPSQFYTNNEITSNYKVGGLVFSSQGDFSILEGIDEEFETSILAEDTSIYFNLIGKIDITGTYPDAHQELLELFPNIFFTSYKDKKVQNKYICTFYYDVMNKIEIIQY